MIGRDIGWRGRGGRWSLFLDNGNLLAAGFRSRSPLANQDCRGDDRDGRSDSQPGRPFAERPIRTPGHEVKPVACRLRRHRRGHANRLPTYGADGEMRDHLRPLACQERAFSKCRQGIGVRMNAGRLTLAQDLLQRIGFKLLHVCGQSPLID